MNTVQAVDRMPSNHLCRTLSESFEQREVSLQRPTHGNAPSFFESNFGPWGSVEVDDTALQQRIECLVVLGQ